MLKKSPSRSSRSKGIKVKHILQIVLLIGVCFWLIYQVKRSHDKKKEFDQKDNRMTLKTQDGGEILKLGRKDLHPHVEEVQTEEKHEEDEEEETGGEEEDLKHEVEEGQEEQKNEVDDQEDEGSKHEEADDDGRGGGDDEIDENDQEKADNDSDREGDFIDDEKLKEERDEGTGGNEEREEGQGENENSSEERDNDTGDENAHEAREEHYKADDASSAVAHEVHSTTLETEEVNSENSNENSELNSKEQDNKSNDTEEFKGIHNSSRLTEEVDNMADNGTSTNENVNDVKLNGNTSITSDGSVQTSILNTQSDDQREPSNNTYSATTGTNKAEPSDPSQQNGTEIGSNHAHNGPVDGLTVQNKTSLQSSILTHSNDTVLENSNSDSQPIVTGKEENPNGVGGESLNITSKTDRTVLGNKTTESGDVLRSMVMQENNEAAENEKSEDNSESSGTGDGSHSADHTVDLVQDDPIDSSDSHVTERVDLDTLPDIRTEVDSSEETAAE